MRRTEFALVKCKYTAFYSTKSWELEILNCFLGIIHLLELDECVIGVLKHWPKKIKLYAIVTS